MSVHGAKVLRAKREAYNEAEPHEAAILSHPVSALRRVHHGSHKPKREAYLTTLGFTPGPGHLPKPKLRPTLPRSLMVEQPDGSLRAASSRVRWHKRTGARP